MELSPRQTTLAAVMLATGLVLMSLRADETPRPRGGYGSAPDSPEHRDTKPDWFRAAEKRFTRHLDAIIAARQLADKAGAGLAATLDAAARQRLQRDGFSAADLAAYYANDPDCERARDWYRNFYAAHEAALGNVSLARLGNPPDRDGKRPYPDGNRMAVETALAALDGDMPLLVFYAERLQQRLAQWRNFRAQELALNAKFRRHAARRDKGDAEAGAVEAEAKALQREKTRLSALAPLADQADRIAHYQLLRRFNWLVGDADYPVAQRITSMSNGVLDGVVMVLAGASPPADELLPDAPTARQGEEARLADLRSATTTAISGTGQTLPGRKQVETASPVPVVLPPPRITVTVIVPPSGDPSAAPAAMPVAPVRIELPVEVMALPVRVADFTGEVPLKPRGPADSDRIELRLWREKRGSANDGYAAREMQELPALLADPATVKKATERLLKWQHEIEVQLRRKQGLALYFASEAYQSEGTISHVVYQLQGPNKRVLTVAGLLTPPPRTALTSGSPLVPKSKTELTSGQYINSFFENQANMVKELGHVRHGGVITKPAKAAAKASKYFIRQLDAAHQAGIDLKNLEGVGEGIVARTVALDKVRGDLDEVARFLAQEGVDGADYVCEVEAAAEALSRQLVGHADLRSLSRKVTPYLAEFRGPGELLPDIPR